MPVSVDYISSVLILEEVLVAMLANSNVGRDTGRERRKSSRPSTGVGSGIVMLLRVSI